MSPDEENTVGRAVETLKASSPAPLPDGFLERFEIRLRDEPQAIRRESVFRRLLGSRQLAAALLMLASLGLIWLILPRDEVGENPTFVVTTKGAGSQAESALADTWSWGAGTSFSTSRERETTLGVPGYDAELKFGVSSRATLKQMSIQDKVLKAEVELEIGTLFVKEEESKVAVVTKRAKVTPVGTQYLVEESPEATQITVLSGSVDVVQGSQETPLRLDAHESVRLTDGSGRTRVLKTKISDKRRGELDKRFLTKTAVLGSVEPGQSVQTTSHQKGLIEPNEPKKPEVTPTPKQVPERPRVAATPATGQTRSAVEQQAGPMIVRRTGRRAERNMDLGVGYPKAKARKTKSLPGAKPRLAPERSGKGRIFSDKGTQTPRSSARRQNRSSSPSARPVKAKQEGPTRGPGTGFDGPAPGSWQKNSRQGGSYPSQQKSQASSSQARQRGSQVIRRR